MNSAKLKILITGLLICHSSSALTQTTATSEIDSLIQLYRKVQPDTGKIWLLAKISYKYSTVNTDLGLKYADSGLKLIQKSPWKKGEAQLLNSKGVNYLTLADYKKAERLLNKSMAINQAIAYKKGLAINLRNLGNLYQSQHKFKQSLNAHFKSIKCYNSINDNDGVAAEYSNIGNIFLDVDEYTIALKYFSNALLISSTETNKTDRAIIQNNMSFAYRSVRNFVFAKSFGTDALNISTAINNKYCESISYRNIGLIYMDEKDFASAKLYFDSSLAISLELKSNSRVERVYGSIGQNYLLAAKEGKIIPGESNTIEAAIRYLNLAVAVAKKIGESKDLIEHYSALSDAYLFAREYNKATENKNLYLSLKKSILSISQINQLNEIELSGKQDIHLNSL